MTDTYDSYERSIEQGRPIQFYRFTLGTIVWCYTNADADITVGGQKYLAVPISDDGIKQNGEAASETMNIIAPNSIGPAVAFSGSPPSKTVRVEVLRMHEGMTSLRIAYVGEIAGVSETKPGQCQISSIMMSATMKRTGLRMCYQRPCPYTLYDPLTCRVNKAAWAISTFIRSIVDMTANCDDAIGKPVNYFAGGFLEWNHPVRGEQQIMIESSTTDGNLVLFDDVQELAVGQPVTLYPGCSKTPTACQGFSNYVNYGGFEYMPGKSPYDGNPLF